MPLVFSLFSSPSETLQSSAVDVLTEMVGKRMEPVPKLNLVQQLNIAPVCARWQDTLPGALHKVSALASDAQRQVFHGRTWHRLQLGHVPSRAPSACTTHTLYQERYYLLNETQV